MKDRYILLIALAIVILQTTLLQIISICGIIPNLMLIYIVVVATLLERGVVIKTAIYSGVLFDIVTSKALALHLSIYLVVVLVITLIEDKIFKENYVTPVVLLVAATVFSYVFMGVFHYFSMGRFLLFSRVFTHLLPEILYNVAIGLPLYIVMVRNVDLKRSGR